MSVLIYKDFMLSSAWPQSKLAKAYTRGFL